MGVFDQYNIQIWCSAIACILSIFLAIFPSQVRITKITKVLFALIPFAINLVQAIGIIIYVFLNGVDNNSKEWKSQEFKHFWEETDILPFVKNVLFISILATVVMIIIISLMKRTNFNDRQLKRYYLKLTDKQRDSGHIIIIGGSMDFLGTCPCRNMNNISFECEDTYNNWIGKWHSKEKCKKCCLNNEQWKQLSSLICNGCRIQIICAHPNNTEQADQTKKLIGFILKSWKKENVENNIIINFFNVDDDPNLRGRIIEDYAETKYVCWNFKTSNRKKNSYERPYVFSAKDRLGSLIVKAFDTIKNSSNEISQEEAESYIQIFENRT